MRNFSGSKRKSWKQRTKECFLVMYIFLCESEIYVLTIYNFKEFLKFYKLMKFGFKSVQESSIYYKEFIYTAYGI